MQLMLCISVKINLNFANYYFDFVFMQAKSIFKNNSNTDLIPHIYAVGQLSLTDLINKMTSCRSHKENRGSGKTDVVELQNNKEKHCSYKHTKDSTNSKINSNNSRKLSNNNGQAIVLMGSDGSGKSTNLLQLLAFYFSNSSTKFPGQANHSASTNAPATLNGYVNHVSTSANSSPSLSTHLILENAEKLNGHRIHGCSEGSITMEKVEKGIEVLEAFTNYSSPFHKNQTG